MATTPRRSNSMNRMWNDFHETFPESETAQDGWIGDKAHQGEVSGHNPDDTVGVKAERSDADSIPEVRAIDKDNRLRNPRGVTLQQVIDRMLQTPIDLKRLIYIIHKGFIWRKANGWRKEVYTGSDKHLLHGHFSGDPAFDEDTSEWTSITSFKESADIMTPDQWATLLRVDERIGTMIAMLDVVPSSKEANKIGQAIKVLVAGGVTQEMLNTAVKTAFLDPTVLAAFAEQAFEGAQRAEKE